MHHLTVNSLDVSLSGNPILKSVSFEARSGEFIGLIGPNGSGKSTLLRSLAGLQPYIQGEIQLDQRLLPTYSPRELARKIGYVPQDTSIGFDFMVRDIVMMGRHAHIPRFSAESQKDYDIVKEAMDRTSITKLADRFVTSLSGGQRQMAFIAKAIAQEPRILLFDEPVSALDINRQLQVLELISELANEGILAIAALHDLNLAARFCDRLILINDGQMQANSSPSEVLKPEMLLSSYQVLSTVRQDEVVNAAAVTALKYEESGSTPTNKTKRHPMVYVFGGAGKASQLLSSLYQLNYKVTIGPLEAHDPDARLAQDLGMNVILAPSFSKFSADILSQCQLELRIADLIIAAPVPIGEINRELCRLLPSGQVLVWKPDHDTEADGTPLLTDFLNQGQIVTAESLVHYIKNHQEEFIHEPFHS